jgi:hypothetical protein
LVRMLIRSMIHSSTWPSDAAGDSGELMIPFPSSGDFDRMAVLFVPSGGAGDVRVPEEASRPPSTGDSCLANYAATA